MVWGQGHIIDDWLTFKKKDKEYRVDNKKAIDSCKCEYTTGISYVQSKLNLNLIDIQV